MPPENSCLHYFLLYVTLCIPGLVSRLYFLEYGMPGIPNLDDVFLMKNAVVGGAALRQAALCCGRALCGAWVYLRR